MTSATLVPHFLARVLKLRPSVPPGAGYTGSATIEGRWSANALSLAPRCSVRQPPGPSPAESRLANEKARPSSLLDE